MFDVTSNVGVGEGGDKPRDYESQLSEGVAESNITSGGFSTLEGIVEECVVGPRKGMQNDGSVRNRPAEQLLGQADANREKARCFPSQSAKARLKDSFEFSSPTQLDPRF